MQDEREVRRQKLMARMATRLARLRGQMTDAEFAQLLADMVRTAERFAEIDAAPGADAMTVLTDPAEIKRLLGLPP